MTPDNSVDGGYIIIARVMLYSKLFSCTPITFKVGMYLLMSAKFNDDDRRRISRGQCRKSLSVMVEDCNVSIKATRIAIETLKKIEFIEIPPHEKGSKIGSLITIINYDKYQDAENYDKSSTPTKKRSESKPKATPTAKAKTKERPADANDRFELFWVEYERKGNKKPSKTQWDKLDDRQMTNAIDAIEFLKQEKPDKKFRKDAERYLRDHLFDDLLERKDNGCLNIDLPFQPSGSPQQPQGETWQQKELRESYARLDQNKELKDHGIV